MLEYFEWFLWLKQLYFQLILYTLNCSLIYLNHYYFNDLELLDSSLVHKEGRILQLTRTNNQYVNVTDFNRLGAYRKNGMLCFNCNLNLSSSITSSMSDFLEIGRISSWDCPYNVVQAIPHTSTSDGSIITLQITFDGIIKIFSTRASGGFYRCFIAVPSMSN